ncbi:MAG TPA: Na+/H+ antiporter [Propionibacteriaceae bacterium]
MHTALAILALVAAVVALTALAERIRFPPPLLLMLAGIGASYVPFWEPPTLSPQLVLLGLLPPLLYAAAIRTSIIDFGTHRRTIASLSVALVVVTALGVGLIAWLVVPDMPFAVAFALGAVVAPPDAVAATAIARSVGLPRRLVTILEGESLVNDATAITCLRVALTAIAGAVSIGQVAAGFLTAAVGGIVVGLAVAGLAVLVRRRIRTPVFDTAVSLMLPFAAYLPAELIHVGEFHGSGVVAVVVAGLILGHYSPVIQSGQSRLSERVNWSTIQFVLENAVFLLIGLQTRRIVEDLGESSLSGLRIAALCVAVLLGVIVLRLVWVASTRIFLFRPDGDADRPLPTWGATFVVGWAGLRGVVTLAAAFLIPAGVLHREVLVFVAMVVTAGTLLLQGLTLPALVRRLGLRGPNARSDALQAATVLQSSSIAALAELERVKRPTDSAETLDLLRDRISRRPHALWERLGSTGEVETPAEEYRRLRLQTLQAERDEVLRVRSSGTVDHEVIAQVLATLDIEESTLTLAAERSERLGEELVVAPRSSDGACLHLESAPPDARSDSEVCLDCLREGTRPVHLRVCLDCGNVGCCDSSVGRHAERHFHSSQHPVMRSFEPGEEWRWCYVDEQVG